MSYLARLKEKIPTIAPESEGTKVSEAPFVPFVAPGPVSFRQITTANDVRRDPAADTRRERVTAMLARDPGIRYAVVTDIASDPEAVILTLGVRGLATGELFIARATYDPFSLMRLMDKYAGCGQ